MEKTGDAGLAEEFKGIRSELAAAIWLFPSAAWNQQFQTRKPTVK